MVYNLTYSSPNPTSFRSPSLATGYILVVLRERLASPLVHQITGLINKLIILLGENVHLHKTEASVVTSAPEFAVLFLLGTFTAYNSKTDAHFETQTPVSNEQNKYKNY